LTAQSSDTSVLPTGNISISGSGSSRAITLTPTAVSGKSTVTVTASDGVTSASTEFTLFVLPIVSSRELLSENFSDYSSGNIVGQTYRGTGFVTGSWIGWNSSFSSSANDAAQFSSSGLSYPALQTTGGKISVKGDGSNLQGSPDLSGAGPFASAGLYDAASGTIGGGNVGGTLYVRFLMRAVSANHNGEYGGLHFSRGTDATGVLIGNAWNALAFSLDYTPTSAEVDLRNNGGAGDYRFVDNNVHLIVAKITYVPGGNDTITAWLDPNITQPEAGQNSATTYIGTVTGDLSFDRFFLRGGNNHQFEYDEIKFGTTWSSVLPVSNSVSIPPPAITSPPFVADNTFRFFFQGSPGLTYSVLATSNLSPVNWQSAGSGTFGFNSVQFNEAISLHQPQRFYRVSIP
jgi:hypothetical protein